MADDEPKPATTDHVASTAVGAVLGGMAVSAAVAAGGIIAAPFTAGASLLAVPAGLIGMGLGGWIGYNRADKKANK